MQQPTEKPLKDIIDDKACQEPETQLAISWQAKNMDANYILYALIQIITYL